MVLDESMASSDLSDIESAEDGLGVKDELHRT